MGESSSTGERVKQRRPRSEFPRHCSRMRRTGSGGCCASSPATSLVPRTTPPRSPRSKRDARAFDGDIRSGAHRDTDIGGRQGGRVIDAVARHRDDSAFAASGAATMRDLSSGSTSASTASMPSVRATASAVVRLSPVSMTSFDALSAQASSDAGVVALIGSAIPNTPATLPSMLRRRWPSRHRCADARLRSCSASVVDAEFGQVALGANRYSRGHQRRR